MNERAIDKRNSAGTIILVTLLLAIGYSVLRYHIVGPVPWKDFPMFILNKGLCLAGFILLTLLGGLAMLFGVLGFVFLWGYNLSFQTFLREDAAFIQFITSRKVLLFALVLGGLHLFFMGYEGWLKPAGWYGGLPPISLVAFSFFAVGYVINLFGRE
jgi:hypothetical protein